MVIVDGSFWRIKIGAEEMEERTTDRERGIYTLIGGNWTKAQNKVYFPSRFG